MKNKYQKDEKSKNPVDAGAETSAPQKSTPPKANQSDATQEVKDERVESEEAREETNESENSCGCVPDGEECNCCEDSKAYLDDLQRLQAEFDNYRKRMQSALSDARQDGFMDAIMNFLPALDSFKMATDMIQDKNTLMGIKFIEKGILDTLKKMGVEEIDCSGMFDPKFHQAIDTDSTAPVESGMIVSVAYKGFIYRGKVIRYAQVVVKK